MKILYLGPVPPLRGGISQHGARLVEALRAGGHEVEVVSWASQFPGFLYPGEEKDAHAQVFPGARFSVRWWNPLSWKAAGRRAAGADLLLFPWVTPFHAPAYRMVLRVARPVRSVVIVHNPLPHERRRLDRPLTRWLLRRVDGVVVHSEASVPELRALGVQAPVIHVPMPPLLPMEPSDLPPAPPYRLLFFGFVRPYKGLDVALAALAELRGRAVDATLTVAGGFWEPVERWQQRVDTMGLTEVVDLRPRYVPDQELPALLAAHHLVVAPYRSATQSAIVPLVHAAGRPVVATSVGGLTEQVEDRVNGILVPPGRSDAFADGIERALSDLPALASHAGESVPQWGQVVQAVETAAS